MKTHVNTYGGMDKDTSYDSLPQNLYIHGQNIRITTHKGESTGSWTNLKGNAQAFTIPSKPGIVQGVKEVIGYATIRNKIILFVADDSDTNSWIYEVRYDEATLDILAGYDPLELYNGDLNFSKKNPIKAIGRYESDCIQRVYWTDYNNFLRSINVSDTDVSSTPLGQIDIYPDVEFVQPKLTVVGGGGAVTSGMWQPAYRLITADGKETLISPPGNLIHVTASSESLPQSAQYSGDLGTVNSTKSLSITIDTSGYTDFEQIELIMIYHSDLTSVATVKSVEKQGIAGQSEVTFIFTNTEATLQDIELDTYTAKTHPFKTVKTMAQKDNALVVANIKGSKTSVQDLLTGTDTFDARTGRHNSAGVLPNPLTGNSTTDDPLRLLNAFNQDFNKDAHWDDNWHTNEQFKFQSDGTRLGGEGPNISYTFCLEPFTMDGTNTEGFANLGPTPFPNAHDTHDLEDGPQYDHNTSYPNNASPFISGLLKGYKRGETYRFGIVFYTNKGESTYVEYIGDIKFPDISEQDSVNTITGAATSNHFPLSIASGTNTFGYSMGIQFTLDFTSCPSLLNEVTSYQIVRLKRTESNSRRLCQGTLKNFFVVPVGSTTVYTWDFSVASDEKVLHLYPHHVDKAGTGEWNGTFHNLATQSMWQGPKGTKYQIKGEAVSFISPEITYDFGNVRSNASNLSNKPMLLLTGAYQSYAKDTLIGSEIDLTTEGSAEKCSDFRKTVRGCLPITFNSKENIKQWDGVETSLMQHDTVYKDSNALTSQFTFAATAFIVDTEFYLRNYYAIPDWTTGGTTAESLNDPQPDTGTNELSILSKGATSIIGKIGKISTDPLDPTNSITPSTNDWFDARDATATTIYPGVGSNPAGTITTLTLTGGANDGALTDSIAIADLLIPRQEVYGGYTQDILEANVFIPASPLIDITELTPKVYGGDVFINMFTVQLSTLGIEAESWYNNSNNDFVRSHSESIIFATESRINLDLTTGSTVQRNVSYELGGQDLTILRQETANTNGSVTAYGKDNDMYAYWDVYSRENDDVTFFIKPSSESSCEVNDIRARLSQTKTNEETIDSWTKFPTLDFYDVDDYGPINEILNWKDEVFFIQDKAFGNYAINREAVISTGSGSTTSLGSGEGFGNHVYHSKEFGSIHQWGVKATEKGIYIFDAIHRKIHVLTPGANELSELKGMHSWVNELPNAVFKRKEVNSLTGGDNPIINRGVTMAKGLRDNEIVFTFLDGDTKYSLVLDELAQRFCAVDTTCPKIYIENGDITLSPSQTNGLELYTHGIGNWGEFYGTVEESYIQFVMNANADFNKILRFLEWNSIVRDDNKVVDRTQTITAFRIQNEYQDSGKILVSSGRIKRRFDKWRTKLPRDINNPGDLRFRSTHFIVTLYFDNTYNKEIIMNRLLSYYDVHIF